MAISARSSGVAVSNPCASCGGKATSTPVLSSTTIRSRSSSYRAATAWGAVRSLLRPLALAAANSLSVVVAMDLPPGPAQGAQVPTDMPLDPTELRRRKAVVLAQLRRPAGAAQVEHRRVPAAEHVHMRWAMVVRVDHEPQGTELVDGGHTDNLICWVTGRKVPRPAEKEQGHVACRSRGFTRWPPRASATARAPAEAVGRC